MKYQNFRSTITSLLVAFSIYAILFIGQWIRRAGVEQESILWEEIGQAIFLGPFVFAVTAAVLAMVTHHDDGNLRFKFVNCAWLGSTIAPLAVVIAGPLPPSLAILGHALAMSLSVWVTFWSGRWIIRGFPSRKKEDEETPIGI